MKPRVVAIGGFDPSGRAGVLADVAAMRAAGAEPLAVVTSITAQGQKARARAVDAPLIAAQLRAVTESGPLHAVKIGVVPDRAALEAIARWLARSKLWVVVDPVRVSSKGLELSSLTAADFGALARKTAVLTPNRQEASALQGLRGFGAIVVKSFHPGTDAIFVEGKRPVLLRGKVVARSPLQRGTGCRFASVLAVDLAKGHTVVHAARAAKRAVRKFLTTPIIHEV